MAKWLIAGVLVAAGLGSGCNSVDPVLLAKVDRRIDNLTQIAAEGSGLDVHQVRRIHAQGAQLKADVHTLLGVGDEPAPVSTIAKVN